MGTKNYLQIFLNKKFIKNIFKILFISLMIVFIMELSLFSIYKIFKVKYFENVYESKLRYGHSDIYLDLKNKKNEILKNPKKKKISNFWW